MEAAISLPLGVFQGPYVHKEVQNMAKINANYEALYILKPDLNEEQIKALVERFKGVVEANGTDGGLLRADDLHRRRRHPRRAGPYFPDHRWCDAFHDRLQG